MSQTVDIRELNERIESKSSFVNMITMGMDQVIVGQKHLVESLMIGLLSDGHILLEGVPGLAKTLAIKTLASLIDAKYSRIQFTPDLLPADVIGTQIYSQKDEAFHVKRGPVFAKCALGVLLLLAVLSWLGFKFREILLIFLAAAAVALAIWYLKTDVIGWRKSWTFC